MAGIEPFLDAVISPVAADEPPGVGPGSLSLVEDAQTLNSATICKKKKKKNEKNGKKNNEKKRKKSFFKKTIQLKFTKKKR